MYAFEGSSVRVRAMRVEVVIQQLAKLCRRLTLKVLGLVQFSPTNDLTPACELG